MALFVVVPTNQESTERLRTRMGMGDFGNQALSLPRGEWMVKFDGTSKQLSDKIGVTTGDPTATRTAEHVDAVLFSFTNYWGHAPKEIWEWIDLMSQPQQ